MVKRNKSQNDELIIAHKEFVFLKGEKEKIALELSIACQELTFQNDQKEKRAAELVIANKELFFQNKEKEMRAEELDIANKELAYQNREKEKRAEELVIANKELAYQNKEKEKRAKELIIAKRKLAFQTEEKEKRAAELITSTLVEIIERKEMEEHIGHLAAIVEFSDDAIVSKTLDGTIKSWNKGAEKMFGYTSDQVVGKNVSLIIPPEYFKEEKMILDRIRNNEIIDHYETIRERITGERFYVSLTISPLKNKAGSIIGVSKIVRDITSRKRFEAEIIQKTEDLVHSNIELAFQNDEKEKRAAELRIANRELAFQNQVKEKQAAELIIANKELAFQNDEKEKRAAELIIANKELIFQNEEKEKRAADLIILSEALKAQKEELRNANEELHEKAQLLQRQEEKLIRTNDDLLGFNQHLEKRVLDRTSELENLNHELRDLSVSKDKFLSVISHDLRNPLTALLLASNELSCDVENHVFDKVQPFAKIIYRSSHNILQQLNELIDWAKKQQEKTIFNPERLYLVGAVNQSLELLKANATQKNIVLENKVPFDIYLKADAIMLRSILQNLVINAIKFSSQGGLVTVVAQRIDKMVEICIIDSGIGMEANIRENLFSKSTTATVAGTNNEKGSGLGLILVKDFVTQHGGNLRVESEIRKGTCIFFTIPEY